MEQEAKLSQGWEKGRESKGTIWAREEPDANFCPPTKGGVTMGTTLPEKKWEMGRCKVLKRNQNEGKVEGLSIQLGENGKLGFSNLKCEMLKGSAGVSFTP